MMRKAKIIMGLALGLTAILVTIDHIRHRLPTPTVTQDAKRNAPTIAPPPAPWAMRRASRIPYPQRQGIEAVERGLGGAAYGLGTEPPSCCGLRSSPRSL